MFARYSLKPAKLYKVGVMLSLRLMVIPLIIQFISNSFCWDSSHDNIVRNVVNDNGASSNGG
jgi:hypothetical protein